MKNVPQSTAGHLPLAENGKSWRPRGWEATKSQLAIATRKFPENAPESKLSRRNKKGGKLTLEATKNSNQKHEEKKQAVLLQTRPQLDRGPLNSPRATSKPGLIWSQIWSDVETGTPLGTQSNLPTWTASALSRGEENLFKDILNAHSSSYSCACLVQGCINCAILLSGIGARGVSSEHMENMEMFSCSPT